MYLNQMSPKPWSPAWLKGSTPPTHFIPLCPAQPLPTSSQQDCLLPPTEAGSTPLLQSAQAGYCFTKPRAAKRSEQTGELSA